MTSTGVLEAIVADAARGTADPRTRLPTGAQPQHGLDQRSRSPAGDRRRSPRDARHHLAADRRARPPGPQLDGARSQLLLMSLIVRSLRRCCRCWPRSPSAMWWARMLRSSGQRRHAPARRRHLQARGDTRRGPPAGGVAILGIGLNVALRLDDLPAELRARTATLGESSEEIEPTLERLLGALDARLARTAVRRSSPGARATPSTDGRSRGRRAERRAVLGGAAPRDRRDGTSGVALADGARTALDAGEVHLQAIG